mmetsp:Transcript_89602/g.141432  ORF Transcript_89602/g.141432 Transcript_89602/m.141432 type:complete len:132 (-) Transcript_89602:204-599(-)|eukprot:CAMPEP_0169130108 /NCGR_PEP_ID=MMETSP1015-20121227/37518_1 /TAXON_ID=342587 /ORGANISM="Karlodinium micrum, Strain CCMP2283" /LENGTH=131 /DNA_ID=CAMNT_0009194241 /DNA_START=45 /DNA_END=440 /DNA_ORIENTATION=-
MAPIETARRRADSPALRQPKTEDEVKGKSELLISPSVKPHSSGEGSTLIEKVQTTPQVLSRCLQPTLMASLILICVSMLWLAASPSGWNRATPMLPILSTVLVVGVPIGAALLIWEALAHIQSWLTSQKAA